MTDIKTPNKGLAYTGEIKSYVLRQGHLTPLQARAIEQLMSVWGIEYIPHPVELNKIFQRENKKILEIGFGMGTATATIAQTMPDYDFLAVEVHGPGVGNLLHLIQQYNLANIRIIRYDAVAVIDNMLPENSLDGVHIFFPDPWPKKRHHKRRLIQAPFIDKVVTKLKPNAYIHLATDWQDYALQMLSVLNSIKELENTAEDFVKRPAYRSETKFELRGKKLGHGICDLIFKKTS